MQIRLQGHVPLDPKSSVIQEVPEVYVAWEDILVHSPPLRTFYCSEGIHNAIEANTGHARGDRNALDCVPGRFSNCWKDQ